MFSVWGSREAADCPLSQVHEEQGSLLWVHFDPGELLSPLFTMDVIGYGEQARFQFYFHEIFLAIFSALLQHKEIWNPICPPTSHDTSISQIDPILENLYCKDIIDNDHQIAPVEDPDGILVNLISDSPLSENVASTFSEDCSSVTPDMPDYQAHDSQVSSNYQTAPISEEIVPTLLGKFHSATSPMKSATHDLNLCEGLQTEITQVNNDQDSSLLMTDGEWSPCICKWGDTLEWGDGKTMFDEQLRRTEEFQEVIDFSMPVDCDENVDT